MSREKVTRSKQEMATPNKVRKTNKKQSSSSPSITKKKKSIETATDNAESDVTIEAEDFRDSPVTVTNEKVPVFKDPNFVHSRIESSGNKKTRAWKNLKQIVAAERALPSLQEDTFYHMLDAPPSFKPAMKYSDLSGLPAKYTDPQTKLRYTTSEEYSRIKMMPSDLVTGCLALRKANIPV